MQTTIDVITPYIPRYYQHSRYAPIALMSQFPIGRVSLRFVYWIHINYICLIIKQKKCAMMLILYN